MITKQQHQIKVESLKEQGITTVEITANNPNFNELRETGFYDFLKSTYETTCFRGGNMILVDLNNPKS